jgi:hypothetical protein
LDERRLSKEQDTLDLILKELRIVGLNAVDAEEGSRQSAAKFLRRILRLYSKTSFRRFVDVPAELVRLVEHSAGETMTNIMANKKALELIQFLSEEATPRDMLNALAIIDPSASFQHELLPVLNKILARGAATGSELSASLLRIKRARLRLGQLSPVDTKSDRHPSTDDDDDRSSKLSVWKSMAMGMLIIDK